MYKKGSAATYVKYSIEVFTISNLNDSFLIGLTIGAATQCTNAEWQLEQLQ